MWNPNGALSCLPTVIILRAELQNGSFKLYESLRTSGEPSTRAPLEKLVEPEKTQRTENPHVSLLFKAFSKIAFSQKFSSPRFPL